MWNVISSNKLLESKIREKNYQDHLNNLMKMKGVIKTEAPQRLEFVFVNPKLQMTRRERLIEIDRQNDILTNKMMNIKNTIYMENRPKSQSQHPKTLNQVINYENQLTIDKQNKRICSKLLKVHSHYPTFQLLKNTLQIQKVRDHISQNARRSVSAKSRRNRPQSSSQKFYRSRISKYDNQGNSSNQHINKLFKVEFKSLQRPLSAPSIKKPIIGQNCKARVQNKIEINQFQTNIFSQFNSQNCSPK